MKWYLFFCFLLVTIKCHYLNSFVEEENLLSRWELFRENMQQSAPFFREYLPDLNVDDLMHFINHDQFLIFYTGRISTGKTTSATTTIMNGKDLLPSKFSENTCVFLFIKSDNSGDNIRLSIQEGENERVLESFPGSSFSPLDAKKINARIEKENQICMNMNSVEEVKKIFTTNLILSVPKMRIDNFSQKITMVDIGGYNVFEGSDISTEIKNQALQKFASKADAAILMLKIDDLVGGDTIEKDLENLFKDRKDLASSKQLILVFNFLEGCLDGSKIKLSDPNIKLSKIEQPVDCTQYLSQLARKRIDEIAKKHTNWKLDIPDENIFILGLRYAQDGLALKDSNLGDQGKIKDSNIEFFFKRLEKMVKTELENKIISSTQRTIQLTSNSISAIDSDVVSMENKIFRNTRVLNEISELKKFAINNITTFLPEIKNTIEIEIYNSMKNTNDVKINENNRNNIENLFDQIKSRAKSALARFQINLLFVFATMDEKILSITGKIEDSPPISHSIYKVRETSFDIDDITGKEVIQFPDIELKEWSEQIRSLTHCGNHWYGGARKCSVKKYKYVNGDKDTKLIYSAYEKKIENIRIELCNFVDENNDEMIDFLNSQIANFQQKIDYLLNQKKQLVKLKDESYNLFNSVSIL